MNADAPGHKGPMNGGAPGRKGPMSGMAARCWVWGD